MSRTEGLGELEQLTLLIIMRLRDVAYGARIRQELEDAAERAVTIGTVYVTLLRLEKKGMVTAHRSDPLPVRGGKAKKCYAITTEGMSALRDSRRIMNRLWKALERDPVLRGLE